MGAMSGPHVAKSMPEHSPLEGWTPEITDPAMLADVIEKAFDYRGDVTVTTRDGARRVGYLFNRRPDVSAPFIQMFLAAGGDPESIPYAEIQSIAFTGRDTAAGNSYAAWLQHKQAARAAAETSSGA
jgi:hypothetical protein